MPCFRLPFIGIVTLIPRVSSCSFSYFFVLAWTFVLAFTLKAKDASALELRVGQSWFEQGDYLLHPGVQATLSTQDKKSLRVEFFGRTFGRFTEATGLLSLNLPFTILPWEFVYTSYGLTLMDEYTAYRSPSGEDESIHAFNFGVNLGIGTKLIYTKDWALRAEWNSHIFAAGLAAIFMTTARKSVFSLSLGYDL